MNEPAALEGGGQAADGEGEGAADEQLLEHEPGHVHDAGRAASTPLETTGESPMASATATIPRTRAGTSLELNMRREHEERARRARARG